MNCDALLLDTRDLLKATVVLLPLLGLTWIIGVLAVNNDTVAFAWIFAILNSLQVATNYYHVLLQLTFVYIIVVLIYKPPCRTVPYYKYLCLGCLYLYIPCCQEQSGSYDQSYSAVRTYCGYFKVAKVFRDRNNFWKGSKLYNFYSRIRSVSSKLI